jgi:hypothetical protein
MNILFRLARVSLCWLLFLPGLETALRAADKPIHVLVTGHYVAGDKDPAWAKFQAACAKEGVDIEVASATTINYPAYTSELMKQFDVVIFVGLPDVTADTKVSDAEVSAFRDRLDAYHRAGGGVLWMPLGFGEWPSKWTKVVGDRYDVKALDEALNDEPKTVDINPAFHNSLYHFIWTTNVAKHPVTDGVRGLLMPVRGEWSWPGTVPMQYGSSWTVLVSGMDSTGTMGNSAAAGSGRPEFNPSAKGTYAGSAQIVGAREGNGSEGRMMVMPFHVTYTLLNFHHIAFNDAFMLNGDGTHPSDGMRLFLNGCKWLAEPAEKAGLGGYQAPASVADKLPLPPIDWSKANFEGSSWSGMGSWWNGTSQKNMDMTDLVTPNAKDFRGIIGVHTVASDGKGSVADYVAAAKAQGLSFIVFLEDVAKSDDARFAKMVADCKAQTTADFIAIPGYMYRDLGNNLHFDYNVDALPLPENLTDERKVKVPNDIVDQNHWENGQGIAELGKLKVDLGHLFLFTAIAPYVYDGAKQTDDGLSKYIYSEGLGHQYAPVSLDVVRDPADLAAVVAAAHLTVVHVDNPGMISKTLGRESSHPRPIYITNGPVITRWGALNPIGHPFWPGKNRFRLALEATSAAGISDVKLIDAKSGEIYRHFEPNGAKTFSCTVDESHKDQWYLVPVITDTAGRTAVGAGLVTYQDGNRTWMMGDRLMGMEHSLGWDDAHKKLVMTGGWLGGILWVKPYFTAGGYPGNPHAKELKIQGIDGGNVYSSAIDISPQVITDAGSEPKVPGYRFKSVLASFDYSIMDYVGDEQALVNKRDVKTSKGWWATPDPEAPMLIADITARTWAVRARDLAPVASNVHEVTVVFKKDVKLDRIHLANMRGAEKVDPMIMAKDSGGEFAWMLTSGQKFSHHGVMETGGYLFPSNYRGGAVGIINLGPVPIDYVTNGTMAQIDVAGNGKTYKAGDKLVIRFVTFMRSWENQTNNEWLTKYIADLGIGCKPGYDYSVDQGKVAEIDYAMDLDAAKGGASFEVKKYDLPHDLVARVNGIPDNAIAGRYDLETRQLLILPVVENTAATSIDTRRGDTHLYVGELFHCDDPVVRLSAVQDGADKMLLEIHNPTAEAKSVRLTAVPGFTPLAGIGQTVKLAPFSSEKLVLSAKSGSLDDSAYKGD